MPLAAPRPVLQQPIGAMIPRLTLAVFLGCASWGTSCAQLPLDESPARSGEWGYHPAEGATSQVNPPSFSWRPAATIAEWEIECRSGDESGPVAYHLDGIAMNVHCPPRTMPAGDYAWRYRGQAADGNQTAWSQWRRFSILPTATELPLPERAELLRRIPGEHPRLFVRPEDLPRLRELAEGQLQPQYQRLVQRCLKLLDDPPSTEEPPKYPEDVVYKSEQWREIWWGNRLKTIAALESAANLAFVWRIGGDERFGQLARQILLDCAQWDPKGATGYRYNDEAGMPYAYQFARTYTFVQDLLSDQERELCRQVMLVRGQEMHRHLYSRHLWQPYSSHSNRAWHFLGEVGIAMLGEVEGADDWIWFAANVFHNTYPVWSDDDGGWHEGFSYWNSYLSRFTWWADVMQAAWGVSAYDKPFFSQVGYYPIYLLPPGKVGGGFGDLNGPRRSQDAVSLMSQVARQAGNGHWQWYVDQLGGAPEPSDYIGFLRSALPAVTPQPPNDLPTSRLFAGTGQAMLNTNLHDATQSVQLVFKSSPFGTQSHGYEANNSFLLWAYGQPLLVASGYRDIYGSDHHQQWMWSTRSVNNITVDGQGQLKHSAASQGEIVDFQTTPTIDLVIGEAGGAYRAAESSGSLLDRFTRAIVFFKPDLVVIYDRLLAKKPASFDYWLHSPVRFELQSNQRASLTSQHSHCDIDFLLPTGLSFQQTDQYDPNPRERIKLREWHLSATTADKARQVQFVTLYWPRRAEDQPPRQAELLEVEGGYVLTAQLPAGRARLLLPRGDEETVAVDSLTTTGDLLIQLQPDGGSAAETRSAAMR